jgi:hypothetical protein
VADKTTLQRSPKHGSFNIKASLDNDRCLQILRPCFYATSIAAQENTILNCADTALTVTEIACENDADKVDILQITRAYAFDILSTAS